MPTKLKLFRVSRGLTQEQIAKMIGYNRMSYASIENGKREPTLKFCSSISEAFSIPLTEVMALFGGG